MSDYDRQPQVNLCGLYAKTSKNGRKYMVGRLAGARVLVFENTRKQSDTEPDYNVVLEQAAPRQQQAQPVQQSAPQSAGDSEFQPFAPPPASADEW